VTLADSSSGSHIITTPTQVPYLDFNPTHGEGRSVFVESYGCQMNVSDTDIVYSIMINSGFTKAQTADNVHLLVARADSI